MGIAHCQWSVGNLRLYIAHYLNGRQLYFGTFSWSDGLIHHALLDGLNSVQINAEANTDSFA